MDMTLPHPDGPGASPDEAGDGVPNAESVTDAAVKVAVYVWCDANHTCSHHN